MPKKESPQKNCFDLSQNLKKRKKTLNKSMGNNNLNKDLGNFISRVE
jgi:hypothetical protein